jgi:NTE family protein
MPALPAYASLFRVFGLCCLILGSVCSALPGYAQTPERRKIGLALGGGSALGIAHAGVVDWLEAHHIPVDYIAGTSMGGLVAGAYATGMPPADIRSLLEEQDWQRTLSSETAYTTLTYRRKEDRRAYPSAIQFSLKKGSNLPTGLNAVPEVSLMLSRIAARVGPVENFSQLPIPFQCVAVDLRSGDMVTLSKGSLATALRATMAIPGLFTPVERDGQLLIDGGVADNIPADVARSMGSDIVIAVDVGAEFARQENIGGLTGVLARTVSILTRQSKKQGLAAADLVLRPDLSAFTGADWTAAPEMVKRGWEVAEANKEKLLPYALPEAEWNAYLAARRARIPAGTFTPRFFEVVGTGTNHRNTLQRRLTPLEGRPLDPDTLQNILSLSSGNGFFDSLTYELIQRDGKPGVRVIAVEKSFPPPTVDFAPIISSVRARNVTTLLTGRVTMYDLGITNSETRLDIGIGSSQYYAGEYFLPTSRLLAQRQMQLFIAPRAFYNDAPQSLFDRGTRTADYLIRTSGAGFDIGFISGRTTEVRLGWEQGYQAANVQVGSQEAPTLSGGTQRFRLRYTFDGQDAPILPRKGLRVIGTAERIMRAPGASAAYDRVEISSSWFQPRSLTDTVFLGASAGFIDGGQSSPLSEFSLGGILRMSAYQNGEIHGRRYYYATAGYLRQINPGNFIFGGRTNAGLWLELGDASGSQILRSDSTYPICISGGVLVETPLGPLLTGASVGSGGNTRLFLSLGRFLN